MQHGSTSSSEDSTGGSNAVNGSVGAAHSRGRQAWQSKLKVKRKKIKKKGRKKKVAPKVTVVEQQKNKETVPLGHDEKAVENKFVLINPNKAPVKVVQVKPFLVCKDAIAVQICDGTTQQVVLQVDFFGLQKALTREGFGIKCTVLSWERVQQ